MPLSFFEIFGHLSNFFNKFTENSLDSVNYFILDEYLSLYGDGDYGADETALLVKHFDKYDL